MQTHEATRYGNISTLPLLRYLLKPATQDQIIKPRATALLQPQHNIRPLHQQVDN